ncbi:MAG: hypothetical protein U1E45_17975 [Geminicoccaceae bacterium]
MPAATTDPLRRLLILHEPEAACRARMEARGLPREVAAEVAYYLEQASDFSQILDEVRSAFQTIGLAVEWYPVDAFDEWLPLLRLPGTMLWSLTDGFAFYRGSFPTSLAALLDVPQFGSPPPIQHMCQDKFRCLALAEACGLRIPRSVLVEAGTPLTPVSVLPAAGPFFVKPNTLGAKLGLTEESRAATLDEALLLCRRIWDRYGDRALIQPYLTGRDVRVSFLDLGDAATPLGIYGVRTGERGWPTLADSFRMTSLRDAGTADGLELSLQRIDGRPGEGIAQAVRTMVRVLGLRDYWSFDIRLAADGTPWFLEFEVCPAVTIYDFLTYVREAHGLGLPEALARAVPLAWFRRSSGFRPTRD